MCELVKLGDLFDFQNGRSFKKQEWKETGLPIIRIQNLNNISAGYNYFDGDYDKLIEVNSGDLLFSWSGTVGSSFGPHIWGREKGVLNQHIYKLSKKEAIDNKYAFYCLKKITREIEKSVVGAVGLVHVTKKSLVQFEIPLPPLLEQQRIVAKLDVAFAEIDKAILYQQSKLKELKELEEKLLEKWFNNENYTTYRLDEICTFSGGSQPPKSEFEYQKDESNIRLIQIRDYKSDKHIVYIPRHRARRICDTTDIMIGRYGPPIFQILRGIEGAYNVALMKAIPKENILKDYLFYFLKNKKIQNYVIKKSTRAAGQSGVNKESLEPYPINLPPINTQKEIIRKCKILNKYSSSLLNLNKLKLDRLNLMRKSIVSNELQFGEV